MKFHTLRVNFINKSTHNSIEIGFEIPSELKENYKFESGQFVSLKLKIKGEEIKRDYSIFSAPYENHLRVCAKAVMGGKVSQYLVNKLKINTEIEVSQPMGKFVIPIKPNEKRTLVFFAAGSGITPIYSIIKNVLYHEKNTKVYLFYANKTEKEVIFKDELTNISTKNSHLLLYNFYDEQKTPDPLFTGRLNREKLKLIINQLIDWDEVDEVLICGPYEMTEELILASNELGIHKDNIHFELFTSLTPIHVFEENKTEKATQVKITLDNKEYEIIWKKNGDSLLDVLLSRGLDPPYSCKGGVCSACTCKINVGDVKMDSEQLVLLESDIKKGLFLPCMTFHSNSEFIAINFDEV